MSANLKQKRSIVKMLTTKAFKKFDSCVKSKASNQLLILQMNRLVKQFEELKMIHIEYMCTVLKIQQDQGIADEDVKYEDSDLIYLDEYEEELDQIRLAHQFLNRPTVPAPTLSEPKDSKEKCEKSEKETIFKVSKLHMQVFAGNMYTYLNWKSEVKMHYLPYVQLDMQNIALKNILSEEVQKKIYGCSSVDEIWQELDRSYGNVSKISSSILNEISSFPILSDANDIDFVKFTDRLHRAQVELTSYQKDSDLDNDHMVAVVEQKLPPRIKTEWAELVVFQEMHGSKKQAESKFMRLLKFLKIKAAAKEYVAHDIRKGSTGSPDLCHNSSVGTFSGNSMNSRSQTGSSVSDCIVHFRNPAKHDTVNCSIFASKTPFERRQVCMRAQACFLCFKRGHRSNTCADSEKFMCYIPGCTDKTTHHGLLHVSTTNQNSHHTYGNSQFAMNSNSQQGSGTYWPTESFKQGARPAETRPVPPNTNPFVNQSTDGRQIVNSHHNSVPETNQMQAMLPVQGVPVGNKGIILSCLYDSGSTISIIAENVAHKLKLSSVGTRTFELIKTGGDVSIVKANIYRVNLIDEKQQTLSIDAYGMKAVSHTNDNIPDSEIEAKFGLPCQSIRRPTGSIDLLVGTDVAGIHPVPIRRDNNLILGRSPFGLVVWGTCMNQTKFYVNHITDSTLNDFFQIETLGVQCTPKCGGCKCGTCPIGGKQLSIREELELVTIKSNIWFERDHWTCSYPWIKDPSELPDNYAYVLAQLYTLERRLRRNPDLMRQYSDQIKDMIERGVARSCTKQELDAYTGPYFYLSHHEVLKESSASTPCRIVFNPAQNFRGHILNEYWALGANLVQSIFSSLLRFREYAVAIMGDISKMYHSVHTTELEWHTHRFLWRYFEDRKPDVYVFLRNSFGDKPAGTIAICAIHKTIEKFGSDHPRGSDTLSNAIYVDDILDSQPCLSIAEQVIVDTEALLAKGGFKVKGWTLSGNPASERKDIRLMENDRVLGMSYDTRKDVFKFEIKLNFQSGKLRKTSEFNLTLNDIPSMIPIKLTKRMLVSQVNGIYDPHGLISPFIVRAKIYLREIWLYRDPEDESLKLEWDDDIPDHFRDDWIRWFSEAFDLERLEFLRCLSPALSCGTPPMMILFSDASEKALAATCYLRYEVKPNEYQVFLVAAKTKVAPLNVKSIVQYELQAAVMSKRLAESVTKALRIEVSQTIFLVDSEIVRAMLCKDSYGFGTFYALRIGEIVETTRPEQWFWVEGALNIADWATRGRRPDELDSQSRWQRGPDFLYEDHSTWPIRQTCSVPNLPGMKSHSAVLVDMKIVDIESVIEISHYSKLYRLIRVTARVLSIFKPLPELIGCNGNRSLINLLRQPTLDQYRHAKLLWIREAQHHATQAVASIHKRMSTGELDKHVPYVDERGMVRARGRASAPEIGPIILPQKHPLSRLIISEVHSRNHDGISTVVTKSRILYWIIGAHRVAKSVRYKCVTCNKLYGNLQRQIMADLPIERTTPALPFQFTSLDLFGPYEIKIPGKSTRGRTFMDEKLAYGVIYTDLSSRAVHVDLVRGYSTDAFLLAHRRFLAARGSPDVLFSDQGSQLVAADKALHKLTFQHWDKDILISHGVKFGTRWKFSSPDSPWQNGASEILIRGVKRSLTLLVGDHPKMTFEELQTVLVEIGNILNERPIGRHPTSPDECEFLRPNDLLLGRASPRIRSGPWENPGGDLRRRFLMVQAMIDDWHKRWIRDYFPTLVPRRKWHTQSREIRVGDLVIVQDERVVRGQWTMGQVAKIHPSSDGRVRNVDIRYKSFPPNEPITQYKGRKDTIITRAVQRLVVIAPVDDEEPSD